MCGRYNNIPNTYQCCTCTDNDCVIEGQAWCRNNEGDACSDGDNDNCAAGLVCGRYNNVETDYQCCTCTDNGCVIEGQAWCRNNEGCACSNGDNGNCAAGLVCGRYNNIETYQCYKEYDGSSHAPICTQYGSVTNTVQQKKSKSAKKGKHQQR